MWDTFEFFTEVLNKTENLGSQSVGPDIGIHENVLEFAMAERGFALYLSSADWSPEHQEFIKERLSNDLSPETLGWYGECAPAVRIFSCLVLGAMLAKYQSGEIDEIDFTLGDAHLAGFIALNNESICLRFRPKGF